MLVMSFPVDAGTRQRLLEAQRAEAKAMSDLESAATPRGRIATRLVATEGKVSADRQALIESSGIERDARVLGVGEATLRRDHEARNTESTQSSRLDADTAGSPAGFFVDSPPAASESKV